ncbi:MAG: acyltransferase [Bacteroidales bacterium]|nr:acyltransferase [Bacteroidales bacterium]
MLKKIIIGIFKPKFLFRWIVKSKAKSCKGKLSVNGFSTVNQNTHLGYNVNFNGMKITGKGKCVIGDNFHSGTSCQIMTDYHNYDCGTKIPYDNTVIVKDVIIENNVWFGNNVIVLPGVSIGEGAVIQAGSVVVKDIPAMSVAGGHPAKVFKMRDIEHYNKLKEQKLFF